MDAERAKRIWDEIAEAEKDDYPIEGLLDGELTVEMYRKLHPGRRINATRDYLNRLVEQGKLVKRQAKIGNARPYAYLPVELDQNKT